MSFSDLSLPVKVVKMNTDLPSIPNYAICKNQKEYSIQHADQQSVGQLRWYFLETFVANVGKSGIKKQ